MKIITPLVALATLAAAATSANAAILYAPVGNPTPLITASPANWFFGQTAGANVPVTAGTQGTIYNTLAPAVPAGSSAGFNISNSFPFTNPLMPVLNHTTGYTVRFSAAITAETHADRNTNGNLNDDDRAGFSIIVASSDHLGIELGFFTDRIFSQNTNFVGQGESVAVNTTPMTSYDLTLLGNTYTLSSNNTTLLTGTLRDYSSFGLPYSIPSWIFLGDDTSSADATAEIAHVELLPVPEPASLSLLALAALPLLARRQKRTS